MASSGFILSPKITDAATITGSATVAGGGVINLQSARPNLSAVFTTTTPYFVLNCGAAVTVNTIAVGFMSTGSATDTVRVRGASSEANLTASPGFDTGTALIWPQGSSSDLTPYARIHRWLDLGGSRTYQWFRVDFSCAAAPSIGRAFLGLRVQPALPIMWGWIPAGNEPLAESLSLSGLSIGRPMGGMKRAVQVEWGRLTRAEALVSMYRVLMERGSSKDFLIVADPDTGVADFTAGVDHMPFTYIGRRSETLELPNTFAQSVSLRIKVEELAPLGMI